jgi:SRSO17 transposase
VRVKVPEELAFQTKPQQAIAMLEYAWQQGVPMRWVTGDEVYGDAPELRGAIVGGGKLYVLAVRKQVPVWTQRPAVIEPQPQERGRTRTRVRLAADASPATNVGAVVAAGSEWRWQRLAVAEGEKGQVTYDWACQRVTGASPQLVRQTLWHARSPLCLRSPSAAPLLPVVDSRAGRSSSSLPSKTNLTHILLWASHLSKRLPPPSTA